MFSKLPLNYKLALMKQYMQIVRQEFEYNQRLLKGLEVDRGFATTQVILRHGPMRELEGRKMIKHRKELGVFRQAYNYYFLATLHL